MFSVKLGETRGLQPVAHQLLKHVMSTNIIWFSFAKCADFQKWSNQLIAEEIAETENELKKPKNVCKLKALKRIMKKEQGKQQNKKGSV